MPQWSLFYLIHSGNSYSANSRILLKDANSYAREKWLKWLAGNYFEATGVTQTENHTKWRTEHQNKVVAIYGWSGFEGVIAPLDLNSEVNQSTVTAVYIRNRSTEIGRSSTRGTLLKQELQSYTWSFAKQEINVRHRAGVCRNRGISWDMM